jgi:hypothetical protein
VTRFRERALEICHATAGYVLLLIMLVKKFIEKQILRQAQKNGTI